MTPVQGIDILSILPFIIATVFGATVLMLEAFQRDSASRSYLSWVTAVGMIATGAAAILLFKAEPATTFHGMTYLDGFTQVMTLLFVFAGAATALVSPGFLGSVRADRGEYYALLFFSVAGMIMMVSAADFIVFFMGLEIMSVAIYALAAFVRRSKYSAEAGMKYFILGAFGSGLLLYGVALIYGATGATSYEAVAQVLNGSSGSGVSVAIQDALGAAAAGTDEGLRTFVGGRSLATIGVVFVVAAFGFKIAAVPFHMWAPDVYQGAPTAVGGYMMAAVKAAAIAALFRVLSVAFFDFDLRAGESGWITVFFALSVLSMIVGNLAAIVQSNVKRMLGYSSIAHAGYLLIGIVAVGYAGGDIQLGSGIVFYLFSYTFAIVGAFGALAWLSRNGQPVETYDDLKGVGYKYPWIGLVLSLFMLSSAGMPPTVGFMGKFMVFKGALIAATDSANAGMAGNAMIIAAIVLGVVTSLAGFYYYLRVIVSMYMEKQEKEIGENFFAGARLAIAICAALTILFGVMPGKLVDLSDRAVAQMAGRADGVYADNAEIQQAKDELAQRER